MFLVDGIRSHPKTLKAGAEASWLWVAAIDYCRDHLTDGFLPADALPTLGRFRARVTQLVARAVEAEMMEPCEGGWRVHDYLDHNDTKATVLQKRREAAQRKARSRDRHLPVPPNGDGGHGPVTPVSQCDERDPLARAFGAGVGGSVTGGGLEGADPPDGGRVLADAWDAWRSAAAEAGTDIRLAPSGTELAHLGELTRAYTLDDLAPAMRAWWASPHVASRAVGLFRAQVADVLAHLATEARQPFRAPPALRPRLAKLEPAASGRSCPHTPVCASFAVCRDRLLTEAREASA